MPRQTARYSPQSSSSYHLGLSGYLIELLCCHLDMEDLRNIIYPGNDKIAPPILNVEVPRFPLSKGLMQKIQFSPVIEFPGNALRGEHSCTGDGGTWAILAHASGIDDQ